MAEKNASAIVDKVWGLCNVLRDDGVSYGDCIRYGAGLPWKAAPLSIYCCLLR